MPDTSKTKKQLLDEIRNLSGLVDSLRQAERNNVRILKALKGSEYRYRAVVEDQTELICRFLPNCTLTFVNDAYCRYFGKSRDELLGYKFTRIMTPENIRMVRNAIKQITPTNPYVSYEELEKRVNEKDRWQQWALRGLFTEGGEIIEFQSVARDVTIVKRIQKNLELKNIALSEILGRIEVEKQKIKDEFAENIHTLAIPLVEKLQIEFPGKNLQYLELLRKTLEGLISSFGRSLKREELQLTTREIEICNMVKNGFTSKEIAPFLHITPKTVEKHRENIRKKFGIRSAKMNLTTFLRGLD